jgi:hypothetical protein
MAKYVLRPNSDDAVALSRSSGSYNYALVDEVTADNDSTYVYKTGTGSGDDIYLLPDPSETGTISNVRVYHCHKKETTEASGYSSPSIKIGGITYPGTQVTSSTGYVTSYTDWANNPNTSSAWTWTDINNLQAGVRLTGGEYTPDKDPVDTWTRCTQVYVEISYAPTCLAVVAAGLGLSVSRSAALERGFWDSAGVLAPLVNRQAGIARAGGEAVSIAAASVIDISRKRVAQCYQMVTAAAFRGTATLRTAAVALGQCADAFRVQVSARRAAIAAGTVIAKITRGFGKFGSVRTGSSGSADRNLIFRRSAVVPSALALIVRRGFREGFVVFNGLLTDAGCNVCFRRVTMLKKGLVAGGERCLHYLRMMFAVTVLGEFGGRTVVMNRYAQIGSQLAVTGGRTLTIFRAVVGGLVSAIFSARMISHWQALTLAVRKTALTLPWRELLLSIPKVRDIPGLRLRHRQ